MSKKFLRTFLPVFLIFQYTVSAQTIQIDFNILDQQKLETLYLADIDLLQQGLTGTAESIFEIIVNAPPDPTSPGSNYENCRMHIALKKDADLIVSWQSDPFLIPANPTPYHLSNELLIAGKFLFDENNPDTRIHFNETHMGDELDNLQNDVLSSGKLPIGVYTLEIALNYTFNQISHTQEELFPFIRATNPSYIQLIAPGNTVGSAEPAPVYTEFPVFQFSGNGEAYQVFVFEKRNEFQTLDDIVRSQPNWESEPGPELSLQYPQDGSAIPLQPGKTYFWKVNMLVESSAGQEKIPSEFWQFKVVDPASLGNNQQMLSKQEIMRFLQDLLGDRANAISRSLEDYQLSSINLNGTTISIQELYRLMALYRGHSVTVYDVVYDGNTQ